MKEISIEDLAHKIKKAKKNNQPRPIFFLGAGASKTGDIPLASGITQDVLKQFAEEPSINRLNSKDREVYAKVMGCLEPYERNELLKGYIGRAKINVTHIYLAQLLVNGYVDYVFTVNFDNLMLRALALFNEYPPTYDIAILNDLTTSVPKPGSVFYLHGQHHGLWLLNTEEEMAKVKARVPRFFDAIKNGRPWVFIGYSGSDPIFDHIKDLGRFDNGLYWVGYENHSPSREVQNFLGKPNTNAFHIKGYDADAFMLKLNEELELHQPHILDKPFTALFNNLNEINDIRDHERFKPVRERLEIARKNVASAIKRFENGELVPVSKSELEVDSWKKELINILIEGSYDEERLNEIEVLANDFDDTSIRILLGYVYNNWGGEIGSLAQYKDIEEAENLYRISFEKYAKAIELNPLLHNAYYNWGVDLGELAVRKEDDEIFKAAFEKYEKATEIECDYVEAYNNWGALLLDFAPSKGLLEEEFYLLAINKFKKALSIDPTKYSAFNNWGAALGRIATLKESNEAKKLYLEALIKYEEATKLKSDYHDAWANWARTLVSLGAFDTSTKAMDLYSDAIDKYSTALDIQADNINTLNSLGHLLLLNSKLVPKVEKDSVLAQAKGVLQKAMELGNAFYNMSCWYALQGEKEEALVLLRKSLSNKEVKIQLVLNDEDWEPYLEDEDFKALISKYKKT